MAGAAAAELTELRRAVFSAADALPETWVVIGVDSRDIVVDPGHAGAFAGYGSDVPVRLSPTAATNASNRRSSSTAPTTSGNTASCRRRWGRLARRRRDPRTFPKLLEAP